MFRNYLKAILILSFIFQGCTALKYLDGDSKNEVKAPRDTMAQTETESVVTKMEIEYLQQQIDYLKEENVRIRDESQNNLNQIMAQNEVLREEIQRLKQGKNMDQGEEVLVTKRMDTEEKGIISPSNTPKISKNVQNVKIKVLSGNGDIVSARSMSKRLSNMGYKVASIGSAPRSDFLTNTVYFDPEMQVEAKELALRLGTNTLIKPLSWPSVFNIIVVTGRNP